MKKKSFTFSSFKDMVLYWYQYAKPFRWHFLGIYCFYAIGIIASKVLIPVYYQQVIDGMVVSSTEMQSADAVANYDTLLQLVMGMAGLWLLMNVTMRIGDWFFDRFRLGTVRNMENGMFADYLKHGRKFFVNRFAGSLLNDHRQMRGAFDVFIDYGTFNFFWWLMIFTGSLISLAFIFPLGAVGIVLWFCLYLAVVWQVSKQKLKHERAVSALNSKMTGYLADNLTNAMTIKTFGAETREENAYAEKNQVRHLARHRNKFWSRFRNGSQGVMLLILDVSILLAGVMLWKQGNITPGVIVLIVMYSNNISQEIWSFSRMINAMTQAYSDADKFMEHVRETPDIEDADNAVEPPMQKGRVCFHSVDFKYPDGVDVFNDFEFCIEPGEKVGIVGPSGSGKSTIITLLLRHMDVQGGSIEIDGTDIRNVPQAYLRSKISLVPQDPSLFHRTLAENIRYGKPDATMEEIIAAAKKAKAHEFIMQTSERYDTLVGERGIKLSGGQRQRIAIARAILEAENAPIVVFDEATSSLDNVSELQIQEAIDAALSDKERTGIIIAHRLSTLRNVDKIIVLDQGQIVEAGTHSQLLALNGLYTELYSSQMLETV